MTYTIKLATIVKYIGYLVLGVLLANTGVIWNNPNWWSILVIVLVIDTASHYETA